MDWTERCVIYLHEMPAHLHECWAVTYPPTVGAKLLTIGHNNVVIAWDKTDPKSLPRTKLTQNFIFAPLLKNISDNANLII